MNMVIFMLIVAVVVTAASVGVASHTFTLKSQNIGVAEDFVKISNCPTQITDTSACKSITVKVTFR